MTIVVLIGAGVVTWLVAFRDTTEPVSVAEAVAGSRTETESVPSTRSPIPEGVYVYATIGYEKTDALGGVTHRYPRVSTITVRAAACGATLTWRVLKERSTRWTYCTAPQGLLLKEQDELHTFFGFAERTTYVCDSTPIKPADVSVGTSWRIVDCGTDDTRERGLARVIGVPRIRVGGETRPTVHVRKTTTFTGGFAGTSRQDLWFDSESAVPVRVAMVSRTTNDSLIGDVHYEEVVTLRLQSLEPRR